ncbi:hypothetical protein [Micromonospora sp. LOL_021]|uniref:hypothetical protein n=1 Tax=Micromonospora sp. LOL_021 TaxID=3345417 RepID=UPI003A88F60F
MDVVDAPRRASFGLSLVVALGWYATVITAVLVGSSGIPAAPRTDCSAIFSCLTPQEEITLLVLLGSPVLTGLLVCTLAVTGLLARLISSPIVAGTLSALGSVVAVAVIGVVWQGAR